MHRQNPSSPTATAGSNNGTAFPQSSGTAKRLLSVGVLVMFIVFAVSLLSPRPAPLRLSNVVDFSGPNSGAYKKASSIDIEVSNNNKNKNKKRQPKGSNGNGDDVQDSNNDVAFWARGAGGRVRRNALPTGCDIRPSIQNPGWSVKCNCSAMAMAADHRGGANSNNNGFDVLLEFAQPIVEASEASCSRTIGLGQGTFANIQGEQMECGGSAKATLLKPGDTLVNDRRDNDGLRHQHGVSSRVVVTIKFDRDPCGRVVVDPPPSQKQSQNQKQQQQEVKIIVINVDVKIKVATGAKFEKCFASIGDWGSYKQSSIEVAELLEKVAMKRPDLGFIVSTGDNFYPTGVRGGVNDPQFRNTFEKLYAGEFTRRLPWTFCLGNHDEWNWKGEIDYGNLKSDRWYFPAATFTMDVPMPPEAKALTIHVLRSYGAPRLVEVQLPAMVKELKKTTRRDEGWKVVVGHIPIFDGSRHGRDRLSLGLRPQQAAALQAAGAHAYLNGDDHLLEVHRDKGIDYFTSGAGGGAHADGTLVFNTTLLAFPMVRGFMVHCVSALPLATAGDSSSSSLPPPPPPPAMHTEFFMVNKPPASVRTPFH